MRTDLVVLDDSQVNRERIARGLTRAALARLAGVSIKSAQAALNGKPVGLTVANKIVGALGLRLRRVLADSAGADGEQSSTVDPISEQTGVGGGASAA